MKERELMFTFLCKSYSLLCGQDHDSEWLSSMLRSPDGKKLSEIKTEGRWTEKIEYRNIKGSNFRVFLQESPFNFCRFHIEIDQKAHLHILCFV